MLAEQEVDTKGDDGDATQVWFRSITSETIESGQKLIAVYLFMAIVFS